MNIHNYKIFDWKGKITNKEMMVLPKKKANELFEKFTNENQNRMLELEKLVDSEFNLDYSVSSLDYLNIWLFTKINNGDFDKFVKRFDEDGEISSFYRSLANDITVYLFEVHTKQGNKVIWMQERYSSKRVTFNNWIGFSLVDEKIPRYETQGMYAYIKFLLEGFYTKGEKNKFEKNVLNCLFDRKLTVEYMSKIGLNSLKELPLIDKNLVEKLGYDKKRIPVCVNFLI